MKHDQGCEHPVGGEIRDVIGNLRRHQLELSLSLVELGSIININAGVVERLAVVTEALADRLTVIEERIFNGTPYLP